MFRWLCLHQEAWCLFVYLMHGMLVRNGISLFMEDILWHGIRTIIQPPPSVWSSHTEEWCDAAWLSFPQFPPLPPQPL